MMLRRDRKKRRKDRKAMAAYVRLRMQEEVEQVIERSKRKKPR
jgi:hypothetical protein